MKRFVLSLLVLSTVLTVPTIALATCNAATIQGTYEVNMFAIDGNATPMSGLGAITFDGSSSLSSSITVNSRGSSIATYTPSGSYSVTSGCDMSFSFSSVFAGTYSGKITQSSNIILFANITDTSPSIQAIGTLVRP
jgi:hypothetical protein